MQAQLKMFEGVQGNKLGETAFDDLIPRQKSSQSEPDGINEFGADSEVEVVSSFHNEEPISIDGLLPPRVSPVRFVPQSHLSPDNPNPYDPASNSTAWAQIRAFFLRGFQE